ncbi:MAG TPA: hypothetical protein VMF06_06340 [Candidatus Limnocylindria bacterium]|jgi:hypothetical protein|nr:hypothetical protein [Candidatus Limnocylindria bacterium]
MEFRDEYYACLAIETELDLGPLAKHLRDHDDADQSTSIAGLTVGVVNQLARRNYREARQIYCDYIEWGQWWEWSMNEVIDSADEVFGRNIANAILRRFPSDDGFAGNFGLPGSAASLGTLARYSPRFEAISSPPAVKPSITLPDPATLTLVEFLGKADSQNVWKLRGMVRDMVKPSDMEVLVSSISLDRPLAACVALAGLGRLTPVSQFDWLVRLWEASHDEGEYRTAESLAELRRLSRAIMDVILDLPGECTLPHAREWVGSDKAYMSYLGMLVLEYHATIEDLPYLKRTLQAMFVDRKAEWSCWIIKAFYGLLDIGRVPELEEVFRRFRFSIGRKYAACALDATSPEFFRDEFALECLWDSEPDTRELAIQCVSLSSGEALARIRCLAHDPFEDEDVRREAQKCLAAEAQSNSGTV